MKKSEQKLLVSLGECAEIVVRYNQETGIGLDEILKIVFYLSEQIILNTDELPDDELSVK